MASNCRVISKTGRSLSELVHAYPCRGEINYRVADVSIVLGKVITYFSSLNPKID